MIHPSEQATVLELDARRKLYDIVKRHAGCHFREIQRVAGLSFGSASYHLAYLQKHGLIKETKDGNNRRYFPIQVDVQDEVFLMLLRQRSIRSILLFILTHEGCNHQEISTSVKLSSSTTTWHLKKLLEKAIIESMKNGKYNGYFLIVPKERIMNLLICYKESFVDELVDGLIELWETP